MKRRPRPSRWWRRSLQQQLCVGSRTLFEHPVLGALVLLLLLHPLRASGTCRPCPFQSKDYFTRVEARLLAGLCPLYSSPLFVAEWCSGSNSPSVRAVCAATFCITRSFISRGSETAARGKNGRHPIEYRRNPYGSLCDLRKKRARYDLPPSCSPYISAGASGPIPRCSSLNCLPCPSRSSSHVYAACSVSWLSTFLFYHGLSSPSRRNSSTGWVVHQPTFISKHHPQCAAARRLHTQLRLLPCVQHLPSELSFLHIPTVYWSRFRPAVALQAEHGTLTHVSDRARRRSNLGLHSSPLRRPDSPVRFYGKGNISGGCPRKQCNFNRAPLCVNFGRWHGWRDNAIQEVCCSVSRCPSGYGAVAMGNRESNAATGVLGNNTRLLQYLQRETNIKGVAERKNLSATERSAGDLCNGWKDVAALQDADQREQEAFERVASQVESQLRLKADAFTTAARNLLQRQHVLQHEFQRRGLQQPDQQGCQTNSSFPTADPHRVGPKDGKYDGEPLFSEHLVTETTDQHEAPQLGASSAQKRYACADGILRAVQIPASFRTNAVASPQALITDQTYREEAWTQNSASVPSSGLSEFRMHKNEGRSAMMTDQGHSLPSPSLAVERPDVARGRQTPVDGKQVHVHVKGDLERNKLRKCLNEKQGQHDSQRLQNGDQYRQVEVETPFTKEKGSHTSTAAAQNKLEIRTSVHTRRPLQAGGGKSGANRKVGDGDEGKRRDRRLIHLLLQSNSVNDVWGLLLHRSIQRLSGAGLVGVVQRLAFLCASPHHQAEQQVGRSNRPLECADASVNEADRRFPGSLRIRLSSQSSAQAQLYMQLQMRAEVKKHPVFKDIMNALPTKIDSLRATEAAALLHALATLRIRSAPELLERTGAVIAAKGFGADSLENVSAEPAALSEPPTDVILGRLWTSIEMFPTLQHHPIHDALVCHTIKRLKTGPEHRDSRGEESTETVGDYDSEMANLQKDCKDSRQQDMPKTAEYHRTQSITLTTAAVIAKAAVQMRLGSRHPNFVAALQSYILRLLVGKDSKASGGSFSRLRQLDPKRARRDATEGVMVRLILSLANLKKQQEQLDEVRGSGVHPSEISPFIPEAMTEQSDGQGVCPSAEGRRRKRSCTTVTESHRDSKAPFTGRTVCSDAAETTTTTTEEEDGLFLRALGTFYSTRIATIDPIHGQLPQLLKGLSYFYKSTLRKSQLNLHKRAEQNRRCENLRSSMASLPELVVAAAVITKQNENSFGNLVVLADLLIDLGSLLQTSKALRKVTTHVGTASARDFKGEYVLFDRGGAEADLERKIQENEWRRGEEFVHSVVKSLASRLHEHLERLHEKLRNEKMAQSGPPNRRAMRGAADCEEALLASKHTILGKSQELLRALLEVDCTLTGDLLVECVRMLVDLCGVSPGTSFSMEDQLVGDVVQEYGGAEKEQAVTPAVDNSNDKSNRGPQRTAMDSSKKDLRYSSVSLFSRAKPPDHSAEEERSRWRQQLLDGSLLLRVNAVYANRSIRRAIHAANTADELLSAVTAGAKLRWPAMSRLQAATAAARAPEGEPTAPSSGPLREVMKVSSVHSGVGGLAAPLDDLSVTSALHRLALLQQRHYEDGRHFELQRNMPPMKPARGNRKSVLYDPRMHLLLHTVATKIPTMGQQVTRVMWALEKLHYFDQRDTADKREQSERHELFQQSQLHARGNSGQPGAVNNGVQNHSTIYRAFFALRRNITLLLLQRTAALVRSECLSGSELSATLRVLAGISFSSIISEGGSPECGTASWAQAVDAILQDIRRSVASSLQRGAQFLSGLDASIALYSLATLGWTAVAPCESPALVKGFNENHFTLSTAGKQHENAVPFEHRMWPKQDKSKLLGISEPPWGTRKNIGTSSDKASRSSSETSSRTSKSSEIEYSTYIALLQRLTAELENCNVQASVVALWALAVSAGRREQISERQNGDMDDRKEEHEILTAIWKVKDVETGALSPCTQDTQDATYDSLKHVVEESLMYEKPLWLLPTEKAFLEAVRDKLEKHIDGMGRKSLSMLLLAAIILRWRQPRLLLRAILRTLDILRMQSRAATAPKLDSVVDGYEGGTKSDSTVVFSFREFRGLEKRGEMHSRIWANLAMLQQQLSFPFTNGIATSAKKMRFKRTRCNGKSPEQAASYLGEFSRAKRQAAAQLKEDLENILSATATWTSRPQHEWTIQQLHSLLLSWIIIEEDRVQHQQQLHIHQNFAPTAEALCSRFLGEDDTRKITQEVFFLLERFASVLLVNTAAQIGESVERKSLPQECLPGAESEAQTSRATSSPAAAANKSKADVNSGALGTELTDQHMNLKEWIKRLSLLLFALRRLRQLFSDSLTGENHSGETRFIPSLSEQLQQARLMFQSGCREQRHWNSSLTKTPLLLSNTSVASISHRKRLLAVAAQVSTTLLRTMVLHPCHPQLPSLFLELRELLVECALWNDRGETGPFCALSSVAPTLGLRVKNDNKEKENLRHDGHGPQKALNENAALGDTLEDLGQALADWTCLHLDEIDDKMYNVVLPLVQTLGAQAYLLRRLRCIALHPVKKSPKTHMSESEMRASMSNIENPSKISNISFSDGNRSTLPSSNTSTKLTHMHPQGDALRSQRLLLRRSRAASLALLLHHRHRIAFHPPSILLSLLNAATEHIELLATVPYDAAHALSTLQRWKIAFGRAETAVDVEVPLVHSNDTACVRQQRARPRVQECCSSPFSPSSAAFGFTGAALHSVLRTRTELLLSGLSQPVSTKNALQLDGVSVAPADVFDAHQTVKHASGLTADKPLITEKEEVFNHADMRRLKSCGKDSVKRFANDGFTQWDMLSLPQLVHASTAAAQLLELPSAKPVWGRIYCTSEILHSGISETANFRTHCASAASRGRTFNDGALANRDTGVGGSSCNDELVAAAAALTRHLLQPAFRTGELKMFSILSQKNDMRYTLEFPQFIRGQQSVTTGGSYNLQNEAGDCLSAIGIPRCTSMHNLPAEACLGQSECPATDESESCQNADTCAGRNALRRSFILTASPRHWRRFRAFVKARRDWLAAAGALRLLGGGRKSRDVAQMLVEVASEIAETLEEYRSPPVERADVEQNREGKGNSSSNTYSNESNLELVDIEKQLAIDDLMEDEDTVYTAEDQSAAGNNTIPAKNLYQRNRATSVEQRPLMLLQQLACFFFEEISYQLEALHAKIVLYRRRADSTEKAEDEKVKQALNFIGARILRALASAPVLLTNAAAFLLQPSFVILRTAAPKQIGGNQQTASFNSLHEQVHTETSSTAEAYTNYLATLLRRLLPLAPHWIPRLNSHRAAALFLKISENVERTHFDDPQQVAEGGTLPPSGMLSVERSRVDDILQFSESRKHGRTVRHQTSTTDEGSSYMDSDWGFFAKSPKHIRKESRRLQTMLLDLQKAILSHARQSPGRMARFWRALMLQVQFMSCKSGKPALTYPESERDYQQAANSTAAAPANHRKRNTLLDGMFGTAAVGSGEQKLDERMFPYQTVFTEIVRFLNELAASAALASDHDLHNSLRGNVGPESVSYRCAPANRPTSILQTVESHQVNTHGQKPAVLPSCSAALQRTERVDWVYGAVAAAGCGLLGDSTQQHIANAAAEISSGAAAYYSMLSFLANSRDAPPEAIASLAQMLARSAQAHLSAVRGTDATPAPSGSFQVKDEARKQKSERHILQECEKTAYVDYPGEDVGREKVTGEALADVSSKSTKLAGLAKAAWLVWIGTSLQQPKQGDHQSILQTGHISRETTDLPKSLDERDNSLVKAAKQELENTADIICGLLREEVLRITKEVGEPNYAEDESTGHSVSPSSEDVYSLLTLSLDTVIKFHIEDGEDGASSHRLPRIEAILNALTLLIDAATHRRLQAASKHNYSGRETSTSLSFPSLPSLAYVLHLARQARVYHGPLLNAVARSIHWHRNNSPLREVGARAWCDSSKSLMIHLKDAGHRGATSMRDEDRPSVPASGDSKVDLWPSLLLLADAAIYQPQEALRTLKRELLLLVEPLVQTAPLNHLVRILRFSMNATPIREIPSLNVRKRGSVGDFTKADEPAVAILDAVNASTSLHAADELNAKRVHDNVLQRCVTEGAALLLNLRPNGKDYSETFEDKLAELEASGYAPVGLIDTLNKVHLLHTISEINSGSATAAEQGNQAVDYSQLPSHLRSASFPLPEEPIASKRTTATSGRHAQAFVIPTEDAGWWPQVLPLVVKHYVRKRSSNLHKAVSGVLSQTLHLAHQNEVWTPTGLSLDICLHQRASDGKPIAVEVDGPTHYITSLASPPAAEGEYHDTAGNHNVTALSSSRWREIPTALTQFKRQLLERTGWHVVSVPFFEWTLFSRPNPSTLHSEARKTTDRGKQSLKQPERSTLGWEKGTERAIPAEQPLPGVLLAAKLRSLLVDPPLDIDVPGTPRDW